MKHAVAKVDEIPLGERRIVDVGGRSIGIFHIASGYYALLNICPHMHAPICRGYVAGTYLPSRPSEVIYGMEGQVLRCHWHGYEYDITSGAPLFGVDSRKLKTYPVEVVGNDILVEVGR